MVTMVDEIFDRHYQAGRDELNAAIASGFGSMARAIGNAFKVLNKIEYLLHARQAVPERGVYVQVGLAHPQRPVAGSGGIRQANRLHVAIML